VIAATAQTKDQRNDFEDLSLTRLKAILPEGVAVTILADRGFGDGNANRSRHARAQTSRAGDFVLSV
jgi:hypothetical protein